MCRFTVRAPPAGSAALPPPQLKLEAPLDLDAIFGPETDDLDPSDLALLAMFNGSSATVEAAQQASSPGSTSVAPANDASNAVVLGQALCPPAGPQGGALGALPPPALAMGSSLAPPNPVQQLQLQAVMQHQAAIMQNPQAFPVAAQMYQQHFLAAQQQAATAAPLMPTKRGKTQEEIEEQTERIKKRRRESAQRSRQRKNAYMKSLEMENRALKMENDRLRMELNKCSGGGSAGTAPAMFPNPSSGSISRHGSAAHAPGAEASGHMSLSDDEDEVPLCGGLDLPALDGGMAAPDMGPAALGLMPTADLLAFAF